MPIAAERKHTTERFEVGKLYTLPDGTQVIAEKRKKEKKRETLKAGETEIHEAKHGVVAWKRGKKVLYMTAVPGVDEYGNHYLGLTIMNGYDPVAAAAPHAHGHDGTAGDAAMMADRGHDIESMAGAANAVMEESQEEIIAIANALTQKGSLSGEMFDTIMHLVQENKEDEYEVIVKIYPSEGSAEVRKPVGLPKAEIFITVRDIPIQREHDVMEEGDLGKDNTQSGLNIV